MAEPANKIQIGGNHYKKRNITKDQVPEGGLDPWDIIYLWKRDYFVGTAIKYLSRWEDKGGFEDLEKAIHWIQKRIEVLKQENEQARLEEQRRVKAQQASQDQYDAYQSTINRVFQNPWGSALK